MYPLDANFRLPIEPIWGEKDQISVHLNSGTFCPSFRLVHHTQGKRHRHVCDKSPEQRACRAGQPFSVDPTEVSLCVLDLLHKMYS